MSESTIHCKLYEAYHMLINKNDEEAAELLYNCIELIEKGYPVSMEYDRILDGGPVSDVPDLHSLSPIKRAKAQTAIYLHYAYGLNRVK